MDGSGGKKIRIWVRSLGTGTDSMVTSRAHYNFEPLFYSALTHSGIHRKYGIRKPLHSAHREDRCFLMVREALR